MRTGQSVVFLLLVLLTVVMVDVTPTDNQKVGLPDRHCPMTFDFLYEAYRSCATHSRQNDTHHQPRQVTGIDVIVRFQEICSSRPRLDKCRKTVLEGCSRQHLQTFQTALTRSFWFCDEGNNLRGSLTRALIGETTVPDWQKESRHCIDNSQMDSCPGKLLNLQRFGRVKGYGNVIEKPATEVLADPEAEGYFRELFNCYFESVRQRCPMNVIPMVIHSQEHLFLPPKFGVNVSALILMKAEEAVG